MEKKGEQCRGRREGYILNVQVGRMKGCHSDEFQQVVLEVQAGVESEKRTQSPFSWMLFSLELSEIPFGLQTG